MLEDGTRCHFSMCRPPAPPPQKGDLQKVLSLREDTETDRADNRKASGAGVGGAGLQSSAPGPPAPVSRHYLTDPLAGYYLLEIH